MLKSTLEDYGYNSYVDQVKLVALYMDVFKTAGAVLK